MFVTKRKFDREIDDLRYAVNSLGDKYWKLSLDHAKLLKHLNLRIKQIPAETKIVNIKEDHPER